MPPWWVGNGTPWHNRTDCGRWGLFDAYEQIVRSTVEQTLNEMLDAEADRLCNAEKYQRNEARTDTRAGHYQRKITYNIFRFF